MHIKLTANYKRFLELSCQGLTQQQIATILYVSPLTVNGYTKPLQEILGIKGNYIALALFAARLGLIELDLNNLPG